MMDFVWKPSAGTVVLLCISTFSGPLPTQGQTQVSKKVSDFFGLHRQTQDDSGQNIYDKKGSVCYSGQNIFDK